MHTGHTNISSLRWVYGTFYNSLICGELGGLLYPTLFNILLGTVVQKWLAGVCKLDILHHGVGLTMVEKDTTFNPDDEIIFGTYIR